ncbi:phosphatidylinositol synthase 1 (CDP-alcohol phosphatidyltransferase1) [Podospora pseudopauciseta]|uniref:Phosphatidylinositol synthase 1 (CDP-alcohol phosphatidyltransferase1) n=2 Tax=Podospora TaxID=5144 RepID=A0ABR0H3S5_9PEZI|nr:phosphatidylinositol synthase 1 (CDP-alcohol phosphatidyltransferase1) [Podospora pseudopauciseta]KAK4670849.1 phosphatidylinositol synthase 1 (CDP-alcohol phosphatidyltransferase1) [Podospora pseudoanserina]
MAGVTTRRQAAAAQQEKNTTTVNGNAAPFMEQENAPRDILDELDDDEPAENIFLFYPNLIGYARIILAVASLYYMPIHPRTCTLLYSISCLLDALDGIAARAYNQSTRFGAVLDMVTDRCTTSCLLTFLASAFPRWAILFQLLISLDLASHYMHMYATLALGGSNTSHKNVDKSRSFLLNLYYTNKNVLFIACFLNEAFFVGLYLLSFSSPLLSPSLLETVPPSTAAAIHQGAQVNSSILSMIFANPYSAGALEMARANKMDSFWPWVITGVSFPVMAFKQVVNVIQLVKASRWLAEGDIEARREARRIAKRRQE